MMGPSVIDERTAELAERAASWRANGWISDEQKRVIESSSVTPWRRHSLPLTITFFVLTSLGLAAFAVFFNLLHLPWGPITLFVAIACAELLILRYRFWRTGVESALWIGGLFTFIVSLPSQHKPEAILLFAAAAAIAGARLRNAIFIALAAVLVNVYLHAKTHDPLPTIAFGFVVAIVAAIALARTWRRPSTEWIFMMLAVALPPAGYFATMTRAHFEGRVALWMACGGIALLAIGIRIRHRAPLISGAIAVALAAFEIHERIPLPAEAKLIVAGALLLTIAMALTRRLRRNTRGFVIDKVDDRYAEAMQIAGTLSIPTAQPSPASPQLEPGGGSFGGGGATGDV
jgi:hypothetical protein